MRMTAQQMTFIANIIRVHVPEQGKDAAIFAVARDLATFNERFDRRRFVKAARGKDDEGWGLTRAKVEAIAAAYVAKYQFDADYAPLILPDHDGHDWVLSWEVGPEDWTYKGLNQPHTMPSGLVMAGNPTAVYLNVRIETINHYSVALYPEEG